ncbi:MAG: DUF7948 domain-containing protein, partial [Gammaproteobacteria bacterium]
MSGIRSPLSVKRSNLSIASPTEYKITGSHPTLPLGFEFNRGQATDDVSYLLRSRNITTLFGTAETRIHLTDGQQATARIGMRFIGARAYKLAGDHEMPGTVNYLTGNPAEWLTNIPRYKQIRANGIYPSIDVVYQIRHAKLEYDIHVAPGGDVSDIQLAFDNIDDLFIGRSGDLIAETRAGALHHKKPFVYQMVEGRQTVIDGRYVKLNERRIGFRLGAYDPSKPVVIDPVVDYASYLGGREADEGLDIAVDDTGQTYVLGNTGSLDFPVTDDISSATSQPGADLFIAKLSAEGDRLIYVTYIKGLGQKQAFDDREDFNEEHVGNDESFDDDEFFKGTTLALGQDGSVYAAGFTDAKNFPTINALRDNFGGDSSDGFVIRLAPDGSNILFSTYWGGSKQDRINAISLDNSGNLYVTGTTRSKDFPVRNGLQMKPSGSSDGFVSKFSSDGQTLYFSSYLGGKRQDQANAICIDSQQRAVIAGATRSRKDFPIMNPLQKFFGGGRWDAFVTRLTADGEALEFSSLLGGKADDFGTAVLCDSKNRIAVAGVTRSKQRFPVLNAFQSHLSGKLDGFIARINETTDGFDFSSYLGGRHHDVITSIAADPDDNIFLTGYTRSTDFPVANSIQTEKAGKRDAFVTQLNETGEQLIYSTYLGGSKNDTAQSIAVDAAGAAYVTGTTRSDQDFPLSRPLHPVHGGKNDAFIVKLTGAGVLNSPPEITSTPITITGQNLAYRYQVTAEDPDGDGLSYFLITGPAGMQIDIDTGLIEWMPDQAGEYAVEIEVRDGHGGLDSQIVTTRPSIASLSRQRQLNGGEWVIAF